MSNELRSLTKMRRAEKLLLFFVLFGGLIVSILAAVGFIQIEKAICFLNEQMWNKHPEIMQDSIRNDYPFANYIKDIVVNVGLYKGAAFVLLGIMIIAESTFLFLIYKRKYKFIKKAAI